MVLDGFRIRTYLSSSIRAITSLLDVEFISRYNTTTDELITYPQTASYKRLRITLNVDSAGKEFITINGNLYKYHFNLNNINSYPFSACVEAIESLCQELSLDPEEVRVLRLEVGFNLHCQASPVAVIDNIITYKFKQKNFRNFNEEGYEIKFLLSEYFLKIYDKSQQFNLKESILRFEKVFTKSSNLKSKGIRNLKDLMDSERVMTLAQGLLACIDDMVIDDRHLDLSLLTQKELNVVREYRDQLRWKELKGYSPDNCRKKKDRYNEIVKKYTKNDHEQWLKESIEKAIQSQFNE
jgi:hypothetical protein